MTFPRTRPRRLRATETLRAMVRETTLAPSDLVLPLFAVPGSGVQREIPALPGVHQQSVDRLVERAREADTLGISAVLLFGIPARKDAEGSSAWDPEGPVPRAVEAIKKAVPGLVVITDVCMCEYTDHGHCGVLESARSEVRVHNDRTLPLLAKEALCHARAGADIVAPSDMMDGRVGYLRDALDREGFEDVAILSYAAKYASAFYGPFREIAESTPAHGDRRGYQMDPANGREAVREVLLDVEEGADLVMIKPASMYLDVIAAIRARVALPIAAYHVSGEYAMLKAAARQGLIDETRATLEILTSIRRAGADLVITYAALDAARALREGR